MHATHFIQDLVAIMLIAGVPVMFVKAS